jgi:hypothetical protein
MMAVPRAALAALLVIATNNDALVAEPRSVQDGVFNAAQVKRGGAVHVKACEACLGPTLSDGDLFEKVRNTMPTTGPNSPGAQAYARVIALILSANRFPDGKAELSSAAEHLEQIRMEVARPPAK